MNFQDPMFEKLRQYGMFNQKDYCVEAFSRNIGLLSLSEQKQLQNAKIAIPGMGGVGGVHLITLSRTGIGNFAIADFDVYEPANINRQFGARVPEFGRAKIEVMRDMALSVNPYLKLDLFDKGIDALNLDDFLDGVDVVVDGLDFFCFDTRRLLFKKAAEKGIYVITAGPMGYSSAMLVFSPSGMGFDEYFNISDEMKDEEKYLSFALGLSPSPTHVRYMDFRKVDFSSKSGPSLNIACQLCSGMAATEVVRIILKKKGLRPVPCYCQFDPYLMKLKKGKLFFGNKNPVQKLKMKIVKHLLGKNKMKNQRRMPEIPSVNGNEQLPVHVLDFLIEAGIQAPSGDNVQPWYFKTSGNSVSLFLNKKVDESFFNVNQLASIISCGAVIENMKIAASQIGLATQVSYLPEGENAEFMARLDFKNKENEIEKDSLFYSIWKRNTNRKFYKKDQPILSELIELKQRASLYSDISVDFITQKEKLRQLGQIIYQADQIRTLNQSSHEHLTKMIRFNNRDAILRKDGFPLKNLEAGFAGEFFLKATKSWNIMNLLNKTHLTKLVSLHSYQGIINSSGVALLSADGFTTESFLRGGRALERLWLAFTRAGYSVQPMTVITLFWLRWLLNGEKEFDLKSRNILKGIWGDFQRLFQGQDMKKRGLIMLFRFGVSDPVSMGTLRKDVNDFILYRD